MFRHTGPWNNTVSCNTTLICSRSDLCFTRRTSTPSIFTAPDTGS